MKFVIVCIDICTDNGLLIVRFSGTKKTDQNAIRWGKLQDSKWIVMPKSCSGFAGPLYSIMDWEADCGYKLCGQYVSDGENQVLFFLCQKTRKKKK